MFDGRWRDTVDRGTGPVGRKLQQVGISADVLTATGLVSAAATAVAVATGHLHLAIVLLVVTGMHDLLDGPVAKASGTSSVRGAFFDSVTDRVADALILGGIAWYLVSTHPGHLVLLPFAVLAVTSLVSYQRAKAESLGISAKGGLMERAERMILLGIAFISASFLVPVLWIMLVLTTATAVGRFVKVWGLAEAPAYVANRRVRRTRTGVRATSRGRARSADRTSSTSASRWRARRQGELSSRSGRTWRARQARTGVRQRTGRRHG
jgi:CDP-diacylglycerol--glycerol-3-phosphate 3-phosphatidyltransferase